MATLYGEVKKRMEQFGVHLPFAIKEIKIDNEEMLLDQLDEKIEVLDNHVTFALSLEHSYSALNELVAKARLAQEYGSLMCSQKFSQYPNDKALHTFTKITTPLLTAYTFQIMLKHLHKSALTKEVMEWRGYYSHIMSLKTPSAELKEILVTLYVALKSNKIIKDDLPTVLHGHKKAIQTYLELANNTPDPYQLVRAVNRLTDGVYYCALDQKDGEECLLLRYMQKADYIDAALDQ